ncbi:DUF4942 domain-containing protein [Psychroflexus aestuariivivens]|uniref:DUF4942 domain-containing protein n=1 Tax=Psychroflexus aestuariivivens TaxID=1795040 RepID=UPI000FDC9055|nr:DUF4942 domain-containing protein [Psychroflexus aestuariivivens]
MFNQNFYPTPESVISMMTADLDIQEKIILEPSAGKGNIVDFLNKHQAKEVLTFEKETDLATIVKQKSTFLGHDFLEEATAENLSHIDYIIANPPFDQAEHHILKMWEVAPEGCTILSLCNMETIMNGFSRKRRQLELLINENGEVNDLGNCFATAERKTNVEVNLVRLFKPVVSDFNKFDGFFMDEDNDPQGNGILPYNEIRNIVQSYVGAVEKFDEVKSTVESLNRYAKPIGASGSFSYSVTYGDTVTDKAHFAKTLQKTAWKHVFNKMKIEKFVTSGVMQKVNEFVEVQSKYPFTMKNIYRMIDIIVQTREQTFNKSMIEVFDKITKHHHKNRYEVEGWKTNKSYLVDKKFILDWVTEIGFDGQFSIRYNGNQNKMNDLHKVLCFLTGESPKDTMREDKDGNHPPIRELSMWPHQLNLEFGIWYDWGFFQIKGFKKGTLHVKFKDEKVWEKFNRKVAEIKGFELPENI